MGERLSPINNGQASGRQQADKQDAASDNRGSAVPSQKRGSSPSPESKSRAMRGESNRVESN